MNQAKFYYFKPSGSYYAEGRGGVPPVNDLWSREALLAVNGGHMPGLGNDARNLIIVVIPDESTEFGWPQIKLLSSR